MLMKMTKLIILALVLTSCTLSPHDAADPASPHTKAECEAVLSSATREQARIQEEQKASGEPMVMYVADMPPVGLGASKEQRLAAFLRLYELGEGAERRDEYFYTGLGYACALGDVDKVRKILELKPDLKYDPHHHDDDEEEDCHCFSAGLMPGYVEVALENGHKELAQELLKRGAAPTGVMICIRQGDLPMLRSLLAAGAKLPEDYICEAFASAKGAEMLHFIRQRYKRCPLPKDILSYLHYSGSRWRKLNESAQRAYLLQAGIITPEDIAAFDRSLRAAPLPIQ